MTTEEKITYLEACGETINPTQMALIFGGNPYSYNLSAKRGQLGTPHMFRGRNLRIFTAPLISILKGGHP